MDILTVAQIAASEWAHAHAPLAHDPVTFGEQVAKVYFAALATTASSVPRSASGGTSRDSSRRVPRSPDSTVSRSARSSVGSR